MDKSSKHSVTRDGESQGFYIETDCCLTCGQPIEIAPELFDWGEHACFLKRQPKTNAEIDRAIRAMWVSEADCIHYAGNDARILKRLGQAGMSYVADDPRAASFPYHARDCVTFTLPIVLIGPRTAEEIAEEFRVHERQRGRTVALPMLDHRTVFLSWYEHNFHSVSFQSEGDQTFSATVNLGFGMIGLAWVVDDWLKSKGATEIHWQASGNTDPDETLGTPI
jgi:hypothetical protein